MMLAFIAPESREMSESEYSHITYDITTHFAHTLASLNPQMTFNRESKEHSFPLSRALAIAPAARKAKPVTSIGPPHSRRNSNHCLDTSSNKCSVNFVCSLGFDASKLPSSSRFT